MKLPYYRAIFLHLSVVFTLLFGFTINAQIIQIGQDIDGETAYDYSGHSVSINAAGDRVAIGAHGNDGSVPGGGHVRIYAWNGISWTQQGQDIDGEAASDDSGYSVSLNAAGDRVAIGAPYNGGNGSYAGHVRIYTWNGTSWTQQGQDIDGETAYDYSGRSVSINAAGDRVAIGAQYNNGNGSNAGHVRIYTWNGTSWMQQGQDIDGEAFGDESGNSVSMNAAGDRVAIGAPGNDGNGSYAGHVRIYAWNGTSWTQLGQDIDGEVAGDESGRSVCMNAAGDLVAIGANGNDGNGPNAGHVRIYAWNGTSWTQQGQDIDGEAADDRSGYSVSLNAVGDRVAIGAYNNDGNGSDAGHVRIYARNGTSWTQEGQDIDGEAGADNSGTSVSMNAAGDRVAIGAPDNDGNGSNAGHVRVYYDPNAVVNVGFEANTDIICLQDTVYFTDTSITNAITWQWRFGDGQSSTQANPYHIYSQEGNYDVTLIISDSAGALDSATYHNYVHVIGPNSVSASSQDSVCLTGGSVHLDVSALTTNNVPYQLSWNTGDTSTQINNLNQGNYSYAMTVNQCLLQDSFAIGTGPNNAINLQMYSDDVSCFGFDGAAGVGVINGQISTMEENFDAGNFSLSGWDNTLSSIPWFISNTSYSNPYAMESGNISNYGNTSVELSVFLNDSATISFMKSVSSENNYDYLRFYIDGTQLGYWSGYVSWSQSTYDIGPGNHVFRWAYTKDGSVSSGSDAAWVDDIIISGNSLSGFTYQWNDPLQQTTASISGLNAGVYQVTVTDSLGCAGVDSAIVNPFTPINVTVNTQDITCEGLTDGTATAVVTGGDAPYTYQFSGGFSSDSVTTSLSTGAYYVNITDQDNCTAMGNFYIYDANVPTINLTATDPSCTSGNDGTISSVITNGNAPYNYLWNDTLQQTTSTATNLTNGTYMLTITDSLNCSYDTSITISNEFIVDVLVYPPSCYGFSDGSAAIHVSNGNSPTFSWSTGATTDSIIGLADGYYLFTVSDGVLCDYTDTAFVEEPDSLILTAQITDVSCNTNNGSIQVNTNASSHSSNVLKMENNGNWSSSNYNQYMTPIYPDKISFDVMSPDISNSNDMHSVFLVEDGSSDLVWFSMSTDVNTSLPVMGPIGITSSSSTVVSSYYSYNVYPFYYTPGTWYHVEFRNISFSTNTFDYYVNNQLVSANIPFRGYPYNVDRLRLYHSTQNSVTSYLDNIDFSSNGTSLWNEDYENGLSSAYNSSYYTNTIVNANVLNYGSAANYAWSNGDTTYNINGLAPGSYTVTVSTSANCSETETYQIVDLGSPVVGFSTTNTSCLGSSDGSATIQVSGGVAPYDYSYNQGNTLENTLVTEGAENGMGNFTSSGTQPFTITSAYNHSGDSAYYNAYGNYNDNYLTCDSVFDFTNMTNGSFEFWHIAKTRGSDDYCYVEYSTNNGSTWFRIPSTNYNGSASTYTGSYPYFDEYSYTLWGSSSSPNNNWWIEESFDLSFLSGNASVMFRFHLDSDNLYTKFGWLIDDISIKANDANDSVIVDLGNGIFSVSVTDQNGCVVSDSTNIGANPYNMNLALTSSDVSCSGATNGSVQVNVTGGVSPYSYYYYQDVSSGGNDTLVNVDAENGYGNFLSSGSNYFYTSSYYSKSGNYSFFNNYDNYDYNYFTYNTNIDLSNATTASLNFWQIAKTEGGYDFCYIEYSDDGGSNWQSIPSTNYNGNANNYSGTTPSFDEDSYTDWGISNNTPSNNWWKEENFDLSFLAGENDVRIRFRLTSNSSSYRYGWLLDDIMLTVNDNQGPVAYDLSSGMVYVQVVDSVGCGITDSTNIGVDSLFNVTMQPNNVTCFGDQDGSVSISVNGGAYPYTYTWTSNSGSNHTEDFESAVNSNYWSSYSGYIGATCGVNSGANALVFDHAGLRSMESTAQTAGPNSSISFYLLYGAGSNNCESVDAGEEVSLEFSLNGSVWNNINTYSLPSYQSGVFEYINEPIPTSAYGSNVYFRIVQYSNSGAGYDEWSLDDVTLNLGSGGTSSSSSITNLGPGFYNVTVTDSAGCTENQNVTIQQPPALNHNLSSTNANCPTGNTGSVSATATGGVPPYTYYWSNGQTASQVNNVSVGTYQCTITDQNGCVSTGVTSVSSISNLSVNLSHNNITCFGSNNGFANVSATGGIPPYSYNWSNGQTTSQISSLGPGTYSATVTDNFNCSSQLSTTIVEPPAININIQPTNTSQGLNNGSASASVTGGSPPYSLLWSSGQVSYNIYNLAPGNYTLTVTDNNNCQESQSVDIQGSVDIQENGSSLVVSITPNPFINEAFITIDGYQGIYDLKVLDIQGKEVERHEKMQGGFVLKKGDKSPGVYFLVLQLEGNKLNERIIIE